MKTVQMTVKEFAEKYGVSYPVASGIIQFAVLRKQAKEIEKVKTTTGKGKPSTKYEINAELRFNLE